MGPLDVSLDGRFPEALGRDRPLALLCYLAVERQRAHDRQALISLFWPEATDRAGRNALRQTLHRLRQALGDAQAATPFILTSGDLVQLNPASDYWLDVDELGTVLAACAAHRHRSPARCSVCGRQLQRAAGLYRGDFLAGYELQDSRPFEMWVQAQRRQLQNQALAGLDQLAAFHDSRADYAAAGRAARQALAVDEFDEVACRHLMRSLALGDQRNAALAHYQAFRQRLSAELGVSPELETASLYDQIRAGAFVPASRPVPHNLPVPVTNLLGREADLAALGDLLADPARRLVTLTGPGGVGKSRLATQVALEHLREFEAGVCFVPLAAIADPDWVAAAIVQGLVASHLSIQSDLAQSDDPRLWASLQAFLRQREVLLLLDNFEHVMAAAPRLAELLAHCPRLTCLVTSREALRINGEYEYEVPALPFPEPGLVLSLDTLHWYASTALFVERAQAARPAPALEPMDATLVADLCRALDGLPLAIELAAARAKALSTREMAAFLASEPGGRLKLLTGGLRDWPERQQTLRATIGWSYDLLPLAEQRLFRRLAVFAASFTAEAAEAVSADDTAPDLRPACAATLAALANLVGKSLLEQITTPGGEARFVMLRTIREFGLEQLASSGEALAVGRQQARYLLALSEQADSQMTGPHVGAWLDRLQQEQENLQAALDWCSRQPEQAVLFLSLAAALWRFFDDIGNQTVGLSWLLQALQANPVASEAGEAVLAGRAKALRGASILAYGLPQARQAEEWLQESLVLCERLHDSRSAAYALYELSALYRHDYYQAWSMVERARLLSVQSSDPHGLASAPYYFGVLAADHGEYRRAVELFEQSLELYRRHGNPRGMTWAATKLAALARDRLGDYERAADLFGKNAETFREMGNILGVVYALLGQGRARLCRGDCSTARASFVAAQAIIKDNGANSAVPVFIMNMGELALYCDHDPAEARRLFSQAQALYESSGNRYGIAWSLSDLADAELALGDHTAAERHQRESLRRRADTNDRDGIAYALESLAYLSGAEGQAGAGARLLGAAAALRTACSSPLPPIVSDFYQPRVGRLKEELGAEAFARFYAEGQESHLREVIAGQLGRAAD